MGAQEVTGAGLMRNRCAFTSRDMAADWPEAFTYAVVFGWGGEDGDEDTDATNEIAAKFGWDGEMLAFLHDAHQRFEALPDAIAAAPADQPEEVRCGGEERCQACREGVPAEIAPCLCTHTPRAEQGGES